MTVEDLGPWDAAAISDNGERVTPFNKDHVFYGHLSIYEFATQFCKEAVVLDAGSGSGYGAAHLAKAGAVSVLGIDSEERAVAFSQEYFDLPNLEFQVMDLQNIQGLAPQSFDFIFTSNVLEHIPDVSSFLRQARALLKADGILLIAVPPITDQRLLYLNLINPYHVNLWTPKQWAFLIGKFFEEITPYLHGVEKLGEDFKPEHISGEEGSFDEKHFVFERGTLDDMYAMFTLTSIFVVRKPKPVDVLPPEDASLDFVDESFTRPIGYVDPDLLKDLEEKLEIHPQEIDVPALQTRESTLLYLLGRVIDVAHKRGLSALLREIVAFLKWKFRSLS